MEFEWNIFPGFTALGILSEIQKMMTEIKCEPEQFQGRIIFMSMYSDIVWGEKGNRETCAANSQIVAEYARKFAQGHWFPARNSTSQEANLQDCENLVMAW